MNRIKIITVCIIVIVLAASAALYLSSGINKADTADAIEARGQDNAGSKDGSETQGSGNTASEASSTATEPTQTEGTLITEDIKIANNSPEYDLKMALTENSGKQTSIKLEYYYEGTGMSNTIDSMAIPEIEGIFEKRAESSEISNAYCIVTAYLNPKLAKAYLIINGNGSNGFMETAMYVVNLADTAVKKVFSGRGKYGQMYFSKDYKYLGYSYNDPLESSVLQESSLLEIINCYTDNFVVRNSRTNDNKKIGSNLKPDSVYDYVFSAWYSNKTVKLRQNSVLDQKSKLKEVLYDISKNLILNMDGSLVNAVKPTEGTSGSEKPPAESAALKALKDFYTYLGSENDYSKGMELLDESFSLKLDLLKQFGISELSKSDISVENASIYSNMLKAAKFEALVKEEFKDSEALIYYYQIMELSPGNQVRQPMSARIKKTGNGWKITAIEDTDGTKPPFAQ